MLTAVEYLGAVGVGVTSPQYFRGDDGKMYVVKFQPCGSESKVAVSEWLAAELGERLGLPFPAYALMEIDRHLIEPHAHLSTIGMTAGRHFASCFLGNAVYASKINLTKAANITEMAGIILFDHIFHNADRAKNKRNILLCPFEEELRIVAIDNSHLFRSSRWNAGTLARLGRDITVYAARNYRKLLKDILVMEDFLPFCERIKNISPEQVNHIISNIPVEWLPVDDERHSLAEYVGMRLAMVEEICDRLGRYIAQHRYRCRWLPLRQQRNKPEFN